MKKTFNIKLMLAECFGTFILVLMGTGSIALNPAANLLTIALSFGIAVMIAAISIGTISGAHLNPIVSMALYLDRRITFNDVLNYWIGQLAGALIATTLVALTVNWMDLNGVGASEWGNNVPFMLALLFEVIGSFLLVFLILTITKSSSSPLLNALMIGLTLVGLILVVGPVSSASLNPTRSLLPALFQGGNSLNQLWVFILGPFMGSLLAVMLFRLTKKN
jgi:aquaporin Z